MDSFNFLIDKPPVSLSPVDEFNILDAFRPTWRERKPLVRIVKVHASFAECVESVGRTVERAVPARKLVMSTICKGIPPKTCVDLVGLTTQTIHFAHIWETMLDQPNGEPVGPLLVNR